jgi:hypothetical protein
MGEPSTKSGNGVVKNKAPTSRELEFEAGKMMTPAPGMESLPQEEIPTYRRAVNTNSSVIRSNWRVRTV